MSKGPAWPEARRLGRNPNPNTTGLWTESDLRGYLRRAGGWEGLTHAQRMSLELARQRLEIAAQECALAGHVNDGQRFNLTAGQIRAGLGLAPIHVEQV